MKKFIVAAAAAALLPMTTPVMAKDICVQANWGAQFLFKNVKSLNPGKKGKMVPLVGTFFYGGMIVPLSGSAIVLTDGTVKYGVFAHSIMNGGNSIYIDINNADATMAGSGVYDNDGNLESNADMTMSSVECSALPPM